MSTFADMVKKAVDEAPSAGYTNVNYGKLTCAVQLAHWEDSAEEGGKRVKVAVPYDGGEYNTREQTLEIVFKVAISELNPALEWDWERTIAVKKNSDNGAFKTDWAETVLPSLEKVFGDNWPKVITDAKGVYAAVEVAPSVVPPKPGKKDYGAPKIIQVFKNLDECKAAYTERYGKKEDAVLAETELGVPDAIIEQAKSLKKAFKGNMDKVRTALENDTEISGTYDVDAILAELA